MNTKISLELDVLTPAFIGGAESRQVDSAWLLRPSSVRGMLRYWFRAAAAAVMRPTDRSEEELKRMVEELRKVEAELFGNTQKRSAVVVFPPKGGTMRVMPRLDQAEWPGLRYMGYGLFEDPRVLPQALITDKEPIRLRLGLTGTTPGIAELLSATLWLWVHFGAIGARSHRGFGSLHLRSQEGLLVKSDLLGPDKSAEDLISRLIKGLDWVTEVFRTQLPKLTSYSIERGETAHIAIRTIDGIQTLTSLAGEVSSGERALERAGKLFQDYRSTIRRNRLGMPPLPDYLSVKTSIQRMSPPRTVDRAAFGLPLPFYFRSLGGAKTRFVPDKGDRLASPLNFRVHRLSGSETGAQRHVVVLYNMAEANGASPLLGRRLVQILGPRPMGGSIAPPSGELIQSFIEWAREQAGRIA